MEFKVLKEIWNELLNILLLINGIGWMMKYMDNNLIMKFVVEVEYFFSIFVLKIMV